MSKVDWSAIPRDVLELISRSFASSDLDYVRFRSVCTTWRSAARPQLPWLIVRLPDVRGGYPIIFFKFSLSSSILQQQVHCQILQILDLSISPPSSPFFRRKRIIGWSHGWMILMDPTTPSKIFIWNPITESTIHLPPLAGCTADADADSGSSCVFFKFFKIILYSYPTAKDGVMLTFCYRHKVLSFCRARGDGAWTRLDCHRELQGRWFSDWVHQSFFHRGRFFVAVEGDVCVYSIGGLRNPRFQKIASLDCKSLCSIKADKYHFVESEGNLLLVLAFRAGHIPNVGYSFVVLKIEWGKKAKLVKLGSLGDRALFVCRKDSFSLSATEFLGCNANSIYYINNVYGKTEIRMYSLKDGSDVLITDGAALLWGFGKHRSWFTPSL